MKSNSFVKRFKKDIKDKREYKKALLFLFLFIFIFTILYLVFSSSLISGYLNYFYAFLSSACLMLLGISNHFIFDTVTRTSTILVPAISEPITITFLCSGILEFCLLVAAMLSSIGIPIKRRIIGALISIPIVIIFNLTRIVFTSYIIVQGNLSFANFVHGFLFRVFLILIVVGTYFFWFKAVNR